MKERQVFGALRATTIAALCAGAGLALAGCGVSAETKVVATTDGKPVDPDAAKRTSPAAATKPAADAETDAEKPGGESKCSGDNKCGPNVCGSKK